MDNCIKLTIKEIVVDFEKLVRHDERLDVLFDHKKAEKKQIGEFYNSMVEIAQKYIPNYEDHVGNVDEVSYGNALKLYEILYENFREIFEKLI